VNRGMRLSPWEAPRFLWAAVEGICGVMLGPRELRVQPLIPDAWQWIALRNLPFQGSQVSFFGRRHKGGQLHLCSTHPIATGHPLEVYPNDVSDEVVVPHPYMHHVALRRMKDIVVFIGNSSEETSVTPIGLEGVLDAAAQYQIDEYNSELNDWTRGETSPAADLCELAVSVNGQGYRILRFTESSSSARGRSVP
jgi:hypothetical protein